MSESRGGAIDFDRLEKYLSAVGYSARLEILHALRSPRAASELRISARHSRRGENPDRLMARQSVEEHLDRLIDAGVVVEARGEAGAGREARRFSVNQQRLYALLEELRRVFTIPGHPVGTEDATAPLEHGAPAAAPPGPKLVLVHGLHEGRVFPLRDEEADAERGWIVGRRQGLHVSLPYDPFVSSENAEVVRAREGGFALRDSPAARNGTLHNWRPLPRGGSVPLVAGDVVGVGRSLLVFRER